MYGTGMNGNKMKECGRVCFCPMNEWRRMEYLFYLSFFVIIVEGSA